MVGSVRAKSASPGRRKSGTAGTPRREGSGYGTCSLCKRTIALSLHGWHRQECQGVFICEEKGRPPEGSLRSVADTQLNEATPDAMAQQPKAARAAQVVRETGSSSFDWREAFKAVGNEGIRNLSDSEGGRFWRDHTAANSETQPEPEETCILLGEEESDKNESVSGNRWRVGPSEELVGQVQEPRAQKQQVEGRLWKADEAKEELLTRSKTLETRLGVKEQEAQGLQKDVELLMAEKRDLEKKLLVEKEATEAARRHAELQAAEKQRVNDEYSVLLSKLHKYQEDERRTIEVDRDILDRQMSRRKERLEKLESLVPGHSRLSNLVADMGADGFHASGNGANEDARRKLRLLTSELQSWHKLPQEVDNLIAAVKQVADRAGAPLLSCCHVKSWEEQAIPSEDLNLFVELCLDGSEESEAPKISCPPTSAARFLTSLPPEDMDADGPASLESEDALPVTDTVELQQKQQHIESEVVVSRPMQESHAEAPSTGTEVEPDYVVRHAGAASQQVVEQVAEPVGTGLALIRQMVHHPPKHEVPGYTCSAPVTPAKVVGGGVSEQRPASADSPKEMLSPAPTMVLTGPCAATAGCSISSLLEAFPPANGPGAPALSTPAPDVVAVTTAKTLVAGPSSRRVLNLETPPESQSLRLPKGQPGAEVGSMYQEATESPATRIDNDKIQKTPTTIESDPEEPLVVRSAKKKVVEVKSLRRARVVSFSDSKAESRPSPSKRRLFPLSQMPGSHREKQQASPVVNQETRKLDCPAGGDVGDDDVEEVSGGSWHRNNVRRRMSFNSTAEQDHVQGKHGTVEQIAGDGSGTGEPEVSVHDNTAVCSDLGLDMSPAKRKRHVAAEEDASEASSPFKRLRLLKRKVGRAQEFPLRRSRRLIEKQEGDSDSIHEGEDDVPIKLIPKTAVKEAKLVSNPVHQDELERDDVPIKLTRKTAVQKATPVSNPIHEDELEEDDVPIKLARKSAVKGAKLVSNSIHEDESEENEVPLRLRRKPAVKDAKFVDIRNESEHEDEIEEDGLEDDVPIRLAHRRAVKGAELVSDSIHVEESEDDDVPLSLRRKTAVKDAKLVDLRKESDDEEEIEDCSSTGDSDFIDDRPIHDNPASGDPFSDDSSDASAGDDTSENPGVEGEIDLKWDFKGDMTAALGKDDLLCMRAVCSLYRHQTQDERAQRNSSRHNKVGFDKFRARRGSELATFLTGDDPHLRLKKTVSELQKVWPNGVEECRDLALHHADQLFRIYIEKSDYFPYE